MNTPSVARLARRRSLAGRAAALAIALPLVAGCQAATAGTTVPSLEPSVTALPTRSAASAAESPAAPSPSFLEPVQIEPADVIDVAGTSGAIWLTSDGQTVWATGAGELLSIDADTDAVQHLQAPVQLDDTTLTIADDGLWATRWAGGRLYRLDPGTGTVQLEVDMPKAVRVAFIGADLWVGREDEGAMYRVDRVTGEVGSSIISQGAYGIAGLGDLWFAGTNQLLRVDPATGETTASIEYPGETNCSMGGAFPDNVWTACFGGEVIARAAARIDPTANSVAAVAELPPTHGGGIVVIAGQPWFVGAFEGSDGNPYAGLLRLDPETGAIDRFLSLAGVDPDAAVVSADALWVPDEAGHRVLKVDFADMTR